MLQLTESIFFSLALIHLDSKIYAGKKDDLTRLFELLNTQKLNIASSEVPNLFLLLDAGFEAVQLQNQQFLDVLLSLLAKNYTPMDLFKIGPTESSLNLFLLLDAGFEATQLENQQFLDVLLSLLAKNYTPMDLFKIGPTESSLNLFLLLDAGFEATQLQNQRFLDVLLSLLAKNYTPVELFGIGPNESSLNQFLLLDAGFKVTQLQNSQLLSALLAMLVKGFTAIELFEIGNNKSTLGCFSTLQTLESELSELGCSHADIVKIFLFQNAVKMANHIITILKSATELKEEKDDILALLKGKDKGMTSNAFNRLMNPPPASVAEYKQCLKKQRKAYHTHGLWQSESSTNAATGQTSVVHVLK